MLVTAFCDVTPCTLAVFWINRLP